MKNKLTAVLLAIILVLAATGCASNTPPDPEVAFAELDPDIIEPNLLPTQWHPIPDGANIATLGEEYVPAILYAYFFTVYHLNLQQNAIMTGQPDLEAFWNLEQDGVTIRQLLLDESMNAAKEQSSFYRLGASLGMTETDEEAKSAEEQIAALLEQMDGNVERFTQTYRLTPEQMREVMRRVAIAGHYLMQTMADIEVPEQALRETYDADPDAFDQVTVRHVLIDIREITDDAERAEATALAESILERVNAGEEIGELAAQYSDDLGSRDTDGEYTFGMGAMVPEFEQWAFAAAPGDTGKVLTQFGYHIMLLMDRTDFEELETSAIEQQARVNIFEEMHQDLFERAGSDDWVYDYELLDKFAASV